MSCTLRRRELLQTALAGGALCAGCSRAIRYPLASEGGPAQATASLLPPVKVADLVSPGCRGTKVRVGKIYAGVPKGPWPTPKLDLDAEIRKYEGEFARLHPQLSDVEFVGGTLVTTREEAQGAVKQMADVDGILLIHLSMGITPVIHEAVAAKKPTIIFAVPYSGHEWANFGALRKDPSGALLECILTTDYDQLAAAIRPLRAIHHMREARILNVTSKAPPAAMVEGYEKKFGTKLQIISRDRVMKAYEAVPEPEAMAEAGRWMHGATAIVEPTKDEIVRSCRLALAFERLMAEEKATVITTDCYGSMYHQLPAFPCIGNVRLNDMGLGGICESDIRSAMTHILLQALSGKPGFISDPTMDESRDAIILAHCLGSTRMDGPAGPQAPYKLRSIMERQEGAVPQVKMRIGQKVTQAELVDAEQVLYFTGTIIDTPETERGCRTKITVKIDGDPQKVWQNWSHGLHRVTCYGDVKQDLERFCRFKDVKMINEA